MSVSSSLAIHSIPLMDITGQRVSPLPRLECVHSPHRCHRGGGSNRVPPLLAAAYSGPEANVLEGVHEERTPAHRTTEPQEGVLLAGKSVSSFQCIALLRGLKCSSLCGVCQFDYRVLHRGTANTTAHPRPVYVVTFAKSWYRVRLMWCYLLLFHSLLLLLLILLLLLLLLLLILLLLLLSLLLLSLLNIFCLFSSIGHPQLPHAKCVHFIGADCPC
jgi:hypothetical protein